MNVVKSTLGVFLLGTTCLFLANPAQAQGRVVVDIPGISIGYYDRHYGNHYSRQGYSKRYRNSNRHNDRCDHRSHRKSYNRYDHSYYDKRDRGYTSSPYRRGYQQSNAICPDRGYSRYRIDRRYCTAHKDHFHCE